MERVLNQLVERLRSAFKDRLVSVILYGSAAADDHQDRFSDLNIFCVLRQITMRELGESEPIFRWWRSLDNPAPLLMSEAEVRTSTDCFPIEFHDMKERRRVLSGEDVLEGLEIDDAFYRAQVEHELRAKLLRLRQKSAGVLSDRDLLLRLMADSISTFCVLIRHALLLAGEQAGWKKRELIAQAAARFELDAAPLTSLLDLREGAVKPRSLDAVQIFEQYLAELGKVVETVDRLER
jgi:predicted nucleotidyltransferase